MRPRRPPFLLRTSPAMESTVGSPSPLSDSSRHTCRTSKNACKELRSSRCCCRALPPSPAPPPVREPGAARARRSGGGGGGGERGASCCCSCSWGRRVLSRLHLRMRLDILGRFVMALSSLTRFDHSRICGAYGGGWGGGIYLLLALAI